MMRAFLLRSRSRASRLRRAAGLAVVGVSLCDPCIDLGEERHDLALLCGGQGREAVLLDLDQRRADPLDGLAPGA